MQLNEDPNVPQPPTRRRSTRRSFPEPEKKDRPLLKPSFNCSRNRGFMVTFPNGYTISVQFGENNYCAKQDYSPSATYDSWRSGEDLHTSPNAEIAIHDHRGNFVPFQSGDQVRGRTDPETFAKILQWVTGLPAHPDYVIGTQQQTA